MKRFLALLLALIILLNLPGCGSVPEGTKAPEETAPAMETEVLTEPAIEETVPQIPGIMITEVMPDNEALWLGCDADWVELYNPE